MTCSYEEGKLSDEVSFSCSGVSGTLTTLISKKTGSQKAVVKKK